MNIYLTVVVKAKPEHVQEIKDLLYSLPELSKKEEACIELMSTKVLMMKILLSLMKNWKV